MRTKNQYWENNPQIVEDSNNPVLENTDMENLSLMNRDVLKKKHGDFDKNGDLSKINKPKEDLDSDEENQSDTIEIDENYPGPKEGDIDEAEKPGINDGEQEDK